MLTYLRELYLSMFKFFNVLFFACLTKVFFAHLSYIVYSNAQEISFSTGLRNPYVGLLKGQNMREFKSLLVI